MLAAPAAIPPNPKIAAIIASITKVTVQRNIVWCVFRFITTSTILTPFPYKFHYYLTFLLIPSL